VTATQIERILTHVPTPTPYHTPIHKESLSGQKNRST